MADDLDTAPMQDQLDADALSGRWAWARQLETRLGALEARSKWALRIASAIVATVGSLAIYARDSITSALERRGEDRVHAAQAAEERARAAQHAADLQRLRNDVERLRGRIEGFSLRGSIPRLTPDPKDDTP